MITKNEFYGIWNQMLALQMQLDAEIMLKHEVHVPDLTRNGPGQLSRYQHAILDEVGELNHELKGQWCWWKDTQPMVERELVLEEFVDVLHFVLSWQSKYKQKKIDWLTDMAWASYNCEIKSDLGELVTDMVAYNQPPTKALVEIMNGLEFDLPEVFEMYRKKNHVNHERQESGY